MGTRAAYRRIGSKITVTCAERRRAGVLDACDRISVCEVIVEDMGDGAVR